MEFLEAEQAELLIDLRDWKRAKADCKEMLHPFRPLRHGTGGRAGIRTTLDEGEVASPRGEHGGVGVRVGACPGACFWDGPLFLPPPDGDEVNFYQVIPLSMGGIQYKLEHGWDALWTSAPDESLESIRTGSMWSQTGRKSATTRRRWTTPQAIKSGALPPATTIGRLNLMAFFLGWAVKRGQMVTRSSPQYGNSGGGPGRRVGVFLLDKLDGKMSTQFFDRRGWLCRGTPRATRSNPYLYRQNCGT